MAAENSRGGLLPSQRSRHRLPRTAAAAHLTPPSRRHDRDPPGFHRRGCSLPPSQQSRRKRPRTAAAASIPRSSLDFAAVATPADQDLPLWPAAVAAVSTQVTKILVRSCFSPESPPPRRLRLRPAAVARRLRCGRDEGDRRLRHGREACRREPPRWPAALASIFKAKFEIDNSRSFAADAAALPRTQPTAACLVGTYLKAARVVCGGSAVAA